MRPDPGECAEAIMFKVLCLLLTVLLPGTCFALEIRRLPACSGIVLRMRGDFKEGDYSRFKAHFKRKQTIVGLDLSSDGGDLEEGLLIANLVHRKKLAVYVAGECDSVCAFVFFSASRRYVGQQTKIGVHSISDDRDIENPGSVLLTVKLARLSAKLGVPNSAIGKMVITPPHSISYLDSADLSALDASAENPFDQEPEKSNQTAQQQKQKCPSVANLNP
jgi:hypothetical protein